VQQRRRPAGGAGGQPVPQSPMHRPGPGGALLTGTREPGVPGPAGGRLRGVVARGGLARSGRAGSWRRCGSTSCRGGVRRAAGIAAPVGGCWCPGIRTVGRSHLLSAYGLTCTVGFG
jgi:hypothetical protein